LNTIDDQADLVDGSEKAVRVGVVGRGDVLFHDAGVCRVVALRPYIAGLDGGDLYEVSVAVLAVDVPGDAVGLVAQEAPAEKDPVGDLGGNQAAGQVLHRTHAGRRVGTRSGRADANQGHAHGQRQGQG